MVVSHGIMHASYLFIIFLIFYDFVWSLRILCALVFSDLRSCLSSRLSPLAEAAPRSVLVL